MTPSSRPLVVGGGTLTGRETVRFYRPLLKLSANSYNAHLPLRGVGDLTRAGRLLKRKITQRLGTNRSITGIGHSQSGLEMVEIAAQDRLFFQALLLLAVPVNGATLAHYLRFVPCTRDMAKGSPYIQGVQHDLAAVAADLPVITLSAAPSDILVSPLDAYVEGADNYCVAPRPLHWALRRRLPGDVMLLPGFSEHLSLARHPAALELAASLLQYSYQAQPVIPGPRTAPVAASSASV